MTSFYYSNYYNESGDLHPLASKTHPNAPYHQENYTIIVISIIVIGEN